MDAGRRYVWITVWQPRNTPRTRSSSPYASFVRTSVTFTLAAAIVSGLPLNVPT